MLGLGSASVISHADGGDPELGEKKFSTCAGCHGIPGYSNSAPQYSVPKIGGQYADYIVNALTAYAEGNRNHDSMRVNASTLSEKDMADIAAYLESADGTSKAVIARGDAAQGEAKSAACVACHGDNRVPGAAELAGQHENYLVHALKSYRSGDRQNPLMNGVAAGLSDEDIVNLAAYYASQPSKLLTVKYGSL